MSKAKKPGKLKLKLIIEVDPALYNRIVEEAQKHELPGTIEETLKNNCLLWFQNWERIIKAMDSADKVVAVQKPGYLLGPDGRPIGSA